MSRFGRPRRFTLRGSLNGFTHLLFGKFQPLR
jgi:hypothetical protein